MIAIAADVQDSEGEATDRDVTASADDAGTAMAAAEAEPDAGTRVIQTATAERRMPRSL